MNTTQLIVLNGASSAGKSTLCQKLQEILTEPYIHLEEDRFVFNTYPLRFIESDLGAEIFQKTMLGYYRSLKAFLSAEHNILADTGFYSTELLDTFVRELQGERVWMVGVFCAIEELEAREQARGDRQKGLAREQAETIHTSVLYDIRVDTSAADVETCAQQVKELVEGNGSPTALIEMGKRTHTVTP